MKHLTDKQVKHAKHWLSIAHNFCTTSFEQTGIDYMRLYVRELEEENELLLQELSQYDTIEIVDYTHELGGLTPLSSEDDVK